ncbi:MAG: hypothetical protein WEC34_09630, partial [Acidimicrobiia bacterium]
MGDPTPTGEGAEEARSTAELEAAERGRAMVAEARAIRRRMLEDAEQRRQGLVVELERVRAEIDAAIAALRETAPGSVTSPELAEGPSSGAP